MIHQENFSRIQDAAINLENRLLSLRNSKGVWDGYLSSSALAVAVATFALNKYDSNKNSQLVNNGLSWLKNNINTDGGYGDTTKSHSNLSTSLLCWSAFSIVQSKSDYKESIEKLEKYLVAEIGDLNPENISNAILTHYADDRTFSVPILAMCALAGRLGNNGWKFVPQLPYQSAVFPHKFFKWLNLSVVSYALPALISMGLVKQKHSPTKNPLFRFIYKKLEPKLLKLLREKQPTNGGFLEATPLTAFVLMTLIDAGFKDNIVCSKAVNFLINSMRTDNSWPIDTSLTTWVTTLSINAINEETLKNLDSDAKSKLSSWLLNQQHKEIHPFTKTNPGGWAWIDTQGGVSDGDDTSGALIAVKRLIGNSDIGKASAKKALDWLIQIQNTDGGLPTFCKGWGKLPFDASCPDISAHALRAILEWKGNFDKAFEKILNNSVKRIIKYLANTQKENGSWLPLWFGNQHDKNHENPVYGTALVVYGLNYAKQKGFMGLEKQITKGIDFLMNCKNTDGSWGGNENLPASIEETALAIKAINVHNKNIDINDSINWLLNKVEKEEIEASPIGLYFASLWYYEKLYPITFALGALNEILDSNK